ncbi:zinc-binding alcohol dehydrogenase family protein [Parapedobacter deserti]|uniref:Zinc-binding alcohol dehydrogenase family protein n=1 Tax=Parapedobacter deserti TaxID=1912957 RepID=A0ABV7JMC4_9SPHI
MDTIICHTPGVLQLIQTDEPRSHATEASLKIRQVGLCGTDLHAFQGVQPYFSYPRILGHELAAEVLDIPSGHGFEVGELVTVKPYFHCGTCVACRQGKTNCCVDMKVYGVHVDGGMRARVSLPITALVKGDGLDVDQLSLVEPLAIGAHGVRRAGIRPGEYVLVMGAGPIGIGTMLLAQAAGAHVIIMDTNTHRLHHCSTLADNLVTIDATSGNVYDQVQSHTHGDMAGVVIDCTGSQLAITNGFSYLAHGGRYVLIGLQQEDIAFPHPEFHKRESTLLSSRNALTEDFDWVTHLLQEGAIQPDMFITHRITHTELPNALADLLDPASGVIKAVVDFGGW